MAIVRYECDKPMAEKKRVLQYCNKKCADCLCAIGVDETGRREHVSNLRQPCGNILTRNIQWLNEAGKSRKRGRPISHRGDYL